VANFFSYRLEKKYPFYFLLKKEYFYLKKGVYSRIQEGTQIAFS